MVRGDRRMVLSHEALHADVDRGFSYQEEHRGYLQKTLIGAAVFVGAIAVGFAAGGVAQYWGGGWG